MSDAKANEHKPLAAPLGQEVRQKTIDVLCESFARDDMDVGELERRLELVDRADTMEELRAILADLPSANLPVLSVELATRPTLHPESIREHSLIGGIIGGGTRAGAWVPARDNWVVNVIAGSVLDLREAQLGPGATEIHVISIIGGVQILVPPDVRVECSGIGIIGSFEHKPTVPSTTDPEAPVIRVNGVAIIGGVKVSVRYPGETARDAQLRVKAKRKAQKLLEKRRRDGR